MPLPWLALLVDPDVAGPEDAGPAAGLLCVAGELLLLTAFPIEGALVVTPAADPTVEPEELLLLVVLPRDGALVVTPAADPTVEPEELLLLVVLPRDGALVVAPDVGEDDGPVPIDIAPTDRWPAEFAALLGAVGAAAVEGAGAGAFETASLLLLLLPAGPALALAAALVAVLAVAEADIADGETLAAAAAAAPSVLAGAAAGAVAATTAARGRPGLIDGTLLTPPTLMVPRGPAVTLALWPGLTSAVCPLARLVTPTKPRATETLAWPRDTATVKWVPLTTAARTGVSTEKCGYPNFSTSNVTVPTCSITVVSRPGAIPGPTAITLRGPTIMDSVPRTSITRVRSSVKTVMPSGTSMPAVSAVRLVSGEAIQA